MSRPVNDDELESELRAAFARQRAADRTEAPAWRAEWLRAAPVTVGSRRRASLRRWLPAALAAACAALALMAGRPSFRAEPRLSEVLPPLFEDEPAGGAAELFADLGPSFMNAESPSDFFLPESLSTFTPLNLP